MQALRTERRGDGQASASAPGTGALVEEDTASEWNPAALSGP